MPLPNTSPDMSPTPTTVNGVVARLMSISRKWRLTDSQAPRAVMPIFLWSYPAEAPEAKASPSQKSWAMAMSLAMSANAAARHFAEAQMHSLEAGRIDENLVKRPRQRHGVHFAA